MYPGLPSTFSTDSYGHLIREALRKQDNLLRDNKMVRYHKERGMIIDKNEMFILK